MEPKNLEALKFCVEERISNALTLMNQYCNDYNKQKFKFYYGQFLAFREVYSLLNNVSM